MLIGARGVEAVSTGLICINSGGTCNFNDSANRMNEAELALSPTDIALVLLVMFVAINLRPPVFCANDNSGYGQRTSYVPFSSLYTFTDVGTFKYFLTATQ